MRKLLLAGLVLVACAKTDDAAVDTTAAATVEPAPTPAQSAFTGTWNGRSYRTGAPAADTGSAWTMTFTSADTGLTGTLRFSGQTTDIPIRVESVTATEMRSSWAPAWCSTSTSPTMRIPTSPLSGR